MRIARILTCLLSTAVVVHLGPPVSGASPQGRIEIKELPSTVFDNLRKLRVWLPPGYDDPAQADRRYPVLYLNDGQTLFDRETSTFSGMEWEADETAERLIASRKIQPIIIVGIDNAGKRDRPLEYLPYFDEFLTPVLRHPQGTKYPEFLSTEVMPYVNRVFRTRPSEVGLGGASYGALAALYSVIQTPGRFRYLLLESPSLYVHDAQILKDATNVSLWPERIFLGIGTNEAGKPGCDPSETRFETNLEAVSDVRKLKEILERKGLDGSRLRHSVVVCAEHNEKAWAERLPEALLFFFGEVPD